MPGEPIQFLLVDHKEPDLLALEDILRRDGLELIPSRSGAEAIEILARSNVALAVIRAQMPEMDGLALAKWMRGAERTRDVPIVFITAAGGNVQSRFPGYELGPVDYVLEPLDPHVLRSKVWVFFELARQKAALTQLLQERTHTEWRTRESEVQTRRVLDNVLAFVGVLDTDGTLIEANRAALDAAEIRASDVLRRKFWDSYWWNFSPESQARLREGVARAAAGEVVRYDAEVRVAGDRRLWMDFQIAPLRDSQGQIRLLIPSALDITERKRTAEELQRSEHQLRTVLDNLPVGVWFTDAAGQIVFGNPAAQKIWAGARYVPPGQYGEYKARWYDTKKPLRAEDWALSRAIHNRQSSIGELLEIDCFDGTTKTISNSAVPILGDDGRVLGAVVINEDVTERLAALDLLRESEMRFRQLAESMPQLVWTAGPDGIVDYYNHRIHQYRGAKLRPDGRWEWEPLLHPDDALSTAAAWKASVQNGTTYQIEHRVEMVEGGYRWHLSRAYPSQDTHGKVVKWFGTATDIDDQKRAQEILEHTVQERTAKLRETVAELEAFSYSIAHDLRAPLRSLHGFSHLLISDYEDRLDEQGRGYLQRIATAALRMDRLVLDVLNYSKIVRSEAAIQPVDAGRLVREIVETYPALRDKGAEIEIVPEWPKVLGNEAMLTQVISNLLGNAVKFVEQSVTPRVRVWAEKRGDAVRLLVRDNGIGIPPEQHEKIFGIFQRAHKSYEGTGIGLAIVQKAVKRMGGTLGVESAPGQGSTFWVELPLSPE